MANKSRVDKQRGIEMRQAGHSYKDIAVALGCSEAWCAKELAGVEKGDLKEKTDITEIKMQMILALQKCINTIRAL